jgi:hypothetical protein
MWNYVEVLLSNTHSCAEGSFLANCAIYLGGRSPPCNGVHTSLVTENRRSLILTVRMAAHQVQTGTSEWYPHLDDDHIMLLIN